MIVALKLLLDEVVGVTPGSVVVQAVLPNDSLC